MIGIRKTVKIPAIPIAKLLIAPSISPSSSAFDVPTAWLAVPIAIPFDILFLILNNFNIYGPKIAPVFPVIIIAIIVNGTSPFKDSLILIPIGVVIDFGNNEIIVVLSNPKSFDKNNTDKIAVVEPTNIPIKIKTNP